MDTEINYLIGPKATAAFAGKSLSPVEVMQACIAKAEAVQPALNCFTETYFGAALDAAKEAEMRFQNGTARALKGLHLAVKEEFRLKGTRRTSSSLLMADTIDNTTDIYIQGAIPMAKTATPEFCIEGTIHSRLWGVAILGTGSDIGGSIRIPAAACGVVGYKPPCGRNPDIEVYNPDYYSQSRPMARSVSDCAMMQSATSGQHVSDIAMAYENANNWFGDSANRPNIEGYS